MVVRYRIRCHRTVIILWSQMNEQMAAVPGSSSAQEKLYCNLKCDKIAWSIYWFLLSSSKKWCRLTFHKNTKGTPVACSKHQKCAKSKFQHGYATRKMQKRKSTAEAQSHFLANKGRTYFMTTDDVICASRVSYLSKAMHYLCMRIIAFV